MTGTLVLMVVALMAALINGPGFAAQPERDGSSLNVAEPREPRRIVPRDESAVEPGFATFLAAITKAAEQGDVARLRVALAEDVSLSFEESSPERLLSYFHVTQGRPWRMLRNALRLGVARVEDGGFVAPYLAGPIADGLTSGDLVVTAAHVHVRSGPAMTAAIIDTLSYEVVTRGPDDHSDDTLFETADAPTGAAAWVQIVTPSGSLGYVHGAYVRSPGDWRFYFKQVDGAWKIWAAAAGD